MNTEVNSSTLIDYKPAKDLLEGRTILVTGAGGGIGKTAAIEFANRGATVILIGRTLSKLEDTYDEIEAGGGKQPAIFPMNFESAVEQDYQGLHDVLESEFGVLDGILFNASALGRRTPIANYSIHDWNTVMQVNVTSPFMMAKSLLPLVSQSNDASIVFTSSSVGTKGVAYWGAYAISKSATVNMMQVLADEMDGTSNIRVNAINPGATRTSFRAAAYPAEDPTTVTSPEEIINRYLFLMGPDSRGVNGLQFDAQPE